MNELYKAEDIRLLEKSAETALKTVEDVKITSLVTLEQSKLNLARVTATMKLVKDKKESITKPLNEALKNVRSLFAPIENILESANDLMRQKMLSYNEKIKRENAVKEAEIVKKVEQGEMTIDKASVKMEKLDAKEAGVPTRKNKVIEIVDETKVPQKYFKIDMILLRADALAADKLGAIIPGVIVKEVDVIVSKAYQAY